MLCLEVLELELVFVEFGLMLRLAQGELARELVVVGAEGRGLLHGLLLGLGEEGEALAQRADALIQVLLSAGRHPPPCRVREHGEIAQLCVRHAHTHTTHMALKDCSLKFASTFERDRFKLFEVSEAIADDFLAGRTE